MAKSDIKVNGDVVISQDKIVDFCRKNHILKLSFFGSILRKDFGPESDVDVLIEFEPTHIPGYIGLAGIEDEFSRLVGGRNVDMSTSKSLSPYFRDEVVEQAKNIYEKG